MIKVRSLPYAIGFSLATASQGISQVIPGPQGPVEFIGLERWAASDLFEAIQATAPDRPFHACAAVMKQDLGFPDAAAFLFVDQQLDGSRKAYTVVVGVEDSSRVKYRELGSDTLVLPLTWRDLQSVAEEDFNTLNAAVYARDLADQPETQRALAEQLGADTEMLDEVWALIDRTDRRADRLLAHQVLARDGSWSARVVATMVLGHFPDYDVSWHGLALSLIDPAGRVGTMAARRLAGLIRAGGERSVQWAGARTTLVALFGGTNPFEFKEILEVLVATDVEPGFGRELVRVSPELLLAHVGAEHDRTREPALAFLRAVSGEDFGRDVEAWKAWISGPTERTGNPKHPWSP